MRRKLLFIFLIIEIIILFFLIEYKLYLVDGVINSIENNQIEYISSKEFDLADNIFIEMDKYLNDNEVSNQDLDKLYLYLTNLDRMVSKFNIADVKKVIYTKSANYWEKLLEFDGYEI